VSLATGLRRALGLRTVVAGRGLRCDFYKGDAVKQLLLAVGTLFTILMLGETARACSCAITLGMVGTSVSADGGVVVHWNGLPPETRESMVMRGPGGESLAFAATSWESGRVCGPGFSVLLPAAPLVVGAAYELSATIEKSGTYTATFTAVAPIVGEDPTPTVDFERVEHRRQHGDRGASCYYTDVPESLTWDYTALVTVSAPGALDGRFIVVAHADNAPASSWVDAGSIDGADASTFLQLPLPDPDACVNVEVYNAQGESVLSVARCQPDRCTTIESWNYPRPGDPRRPTAPTTCELTPDPDADASADPDADAGADAGADASSDSDSGADAEADPGEDASPDPGEDAAPAAAGPGSGCDARTTPPTGHALWLLAALAALGWRRRRARSSRTSAL
jgi:MYXO-CTERM domain-containing protein